MSGLLFVFAVGEIQLLPLSQNYLLGLYPMFKKKVCFFFFLKQLLGV